MSKDKRAEIVEAMARALYGCDQAGLAEAKSIGMKLVSGAITPWENLHQENREGYLRRARPALDIALKAAAEIADGFRCGACGMDGAASAAILALKESANDKG